MAHAMRGLMCVGLLVGCVGSSSQAVRPGIEVLLDDSLHLVTGRRVGLLTNQTGIDRAGTGDVELLLAAEVELTAIFSPEHGFRGRLDQPDIQHDLDSATGLPIYSLYGSTRAPTDRMLAGIDVIVIDLQDIGARPYTYVSTALLTMQAAAARDLPVIVLDRPNPIGGIHVQGPMLDPAFASFVGMLPVSLRHGMTLGELTMLGNDVLAIGASLTVVPAAGWRRAMWYDETGLPWVRPSPNMPNLESATHYPGLVLFEGTNLSVGRGTATAFQWIGAPWLDPERVIAAFGHAPGVEVQADSMTPRGPGDGKYPGRTLPAIRFTVVDRDVYDPTVVAIRMLAVIAATHSADFQIRNPGYFDARTGSPEIREGLEGAVGLAGSITPGLDEALVVFRRLRDQYLLYQ